LRIGVIGLEWFGELHCETIKGISNLELYGISTRNKTRINLLQHKFRCPVATTNYEDLLLDEKVELIAICTPPVSHAAIAFAALRKNKNVLVEKPISNDLAQAEEMIEASFNSHGKLFIGHICRFNIRYHEATFMIESGEIGEIIAITTYRQLPASRAKSLLQDTSPFVSDAIHDINLILWSTQLVSNEIYAQTSKRRNFKNPDWGHIIIKTDSGILANMRINWHMPDQTPYGVDEYYQVVGTKGCV
jgi:UDP-N-acetylglucosamine 3-dehydrogenase